jgi:2-polyprenyl-6-methoxyphenol hydroxylase-like FAD-dependent oxidoreductase
MTEPQASADCVIVGGGPAGMILALLLARRGVRVRVLEAHSDFERDFRGDTLHPGAMEVLDRIGLAEDVHALRHGKLRAMRLFTPGRTWKLVQFERLKTRFPYVMTVPQARFLELLHDRARRYPHFALTFHANVKELIEEDGVVTGVRYEDETGAVHEVRARLTVAADGRASRVRKQAGLVPESQSPEMDVIWLRLPKAEGDPPQEGALYSGGGHFMVVLDREADWQAGYVIPKGGYTRLRAAGIAELRKNVAALAPWLADRAAALHDWKEVHVLTVQADRVPRWHKPGLLLVGDAAHAMSPIGGVGINYAIGDAVEAANVLSEALREGGPIDEAALAEVQRRREGAVRTIQRIQAAVQDRVVGESLRHEKPLVLPWPLRVILKTPFLRDIPARMLSFGPRPYRLERADEHPAIADGRRLVGRGLTSAQKMIVAGGMVAGSIWLAGTSALAQEVQIDYDRNAPFAACATYTWVEGQPAADPAADRQIVDAIDSALAARGSKRVPAAAACHVAYQASVRPQKRLQPLGAAGLATGAVTADVEGAAEGVLVVSILDPARGQTVWRAVAAGTPANHFEKNRKGLARCVAKMFKDFPPRFAND